MCEKLGIELIAASSPQAKGRVERMHGTHQDRLVKKLRRKEIATHAQANAYLEAEYLPEHNRRFARAACRAEDYHRREPRAAGVGQDLSGWRVYGGSATTGWCATTIAFSNFSAESHTHRRRAKVAGL